VSVRAVVLQLAELGIVERAEYPESREPGQTNAAGDEGPGRSDEPPELSAWALPLTTGAGSG
jgi:hypothetical protein